MIPDVIGHHDNSGKPDVPVKDIRIDPDQTDEYNNSLVFGNDSKVTETQNHGNILANSNSQGRHGHNGVTQHGETQLDIQNDILPEDLNSSPKSDSSRYQYEFKKNENPLADTQVINLPQAYGAETQQIPRPVNDADTQVISNVINGDTQVITPYEQNHQNSDTQVISKPKVPVFRDPDVTDQDTNESFVEQETIRRSSDFASEVNHISGNNVSSGNDANDTLGIRLTPSSPSVTSTTSNKDTSGGSQAFDYSSSNKSNNLAVSGPINTQSPHTQLEYTKSLVEIPGTVERNGVTTQVPNTQEEHPGDSSVDYGINEESADEGSIHTDDEQFVPMYEDSVLNHKIKLLNQLPVESDPESPIKMPREQRNSGEEEEKIHLPNKRQKPNVVESQSPDRSPATPRRQKTHDVTPSSQVSGQVLRQETSKVLTESDVISRASVFANHKFRMYTGIVNNTGKEQSEILFEEGAYDIDNNDLYPLDIRIGDAVKIRGSAVPYVVTGLSYETSQTGIRCIRGYNRVFLQKQRRSRKTKPEEVQVNVSQLYMELTDWYQHQQQFEVDLKESLLDDTLTSIINDNIRTPTRNRHTQDIMKSESHNSPRKRSEGVLSDCLFCITSLNDDSKNQLIKTIYSHGGSIIEEGFMELFSYRKSHRLELSFKNKESGEFKFAALISNGISRSSKYLQTVALGWPILSERFIHDVTEKQVDFNEWPAYLLAAGVSSIIDNTKSLDIFRFRLGFDKGQDINTQINNNTHLLEGCTIVGLDNITNNKEIVTCEFMFYAFGAKNFIIKSSLSELMDFVKKNKSKTGTILVYDNSKAISQPIKGVRIINWEWVVQCCISNHIWN